jgi:hypothetical protein
MLSQFPQPLPVQRSLPQLPLQLNAAAHEGGMSLQANE